MHLLGLRLKQATGLPWVADFRDPWSTMDYLNEFHLTSITRKRIQSMERDVIQTADRLLVTSPGALQELGVLNLPKVWCSPMVGTKTTFQCQHRLQLCTTESL